MLLDAQGANSTRGGSVTSATRANRATRARGARRVREARDACERRATRARGARRVREARDACERRATRARGAHGATATKTIRYNEGPLMDRVKNSRQVKIKKSRYLRLPSKENNFKVTYVPNFFGNVRGRVTISLD